MTKDDMFYLELLRRIIVEKYDEKDKGRQMMCKLIDAEMDRYKINQKYANTYKHIADAFAYMLPLYLDMANEYQRAVALDVLSYLKIGKEAGHDT
mgnify:CR=1 FL=1